MLTSSRGKVAMPVVRCLCTIGVFLPAAGVAGAQPASAPAAAVFNVRDYGAGGQMSADARPGLQRAIDACAAAGGGLVYLPPGAYVSGTLHLKSHVRLHLEAGATLYASKDKAAFGPEALLYGADLENITIEGRGTIDGRAQYEWRPDDIEDDFIRPNEERMRKLGKSTRRSFPRADQVGKLILLLRCRDVRISGLTLRDSPSWTIHPYGCERMVIDGVYIRSSLAEGVWADGIDPDGCRDLRIANCTIETGDDALVFYSMNWFGPALPCENITVTNCRLSSASSAIKFCDGNMNAIRNVTIDNCVITGSNRGIAFMNFDGGLVSDVVLSNLVIECVRHDWFWWGDGDPLHFNVQRRSEVHRSVPPGTDAPAGRIRRVLISNVLARGQGSSVCNGHPDSWLEDITIERLRLHLTADPRAPYDKSVHALEFARVRNLILRDVQVTWGTPAGENWESALVLRQVRGAVIEGLAGGPAPGRRGDAPAIVLEQVENAVIRHGRPAADTPVFVHVAGDSRGIVLAGNDLRSVGRPWTAEAGLHEAVVELGNIPPPAGGR